MKRITAKQVIPGAAIVLALVYLYIGVTQLGFWDDINGPEAGFFPTIASFVMIIGGSLALVQSRKEGAASYDREEFYVIAGAACIIMMSVIIGLVPSAVLFVAAWLKLLEKESWKKTLMVTAVISVIVVGVFVLWLQVPFPQGIVGDWLGGI